MPRQPAAPAATLAGRGRGCCSSSLVPTAYCFQFSRHPLNSVRALAPEPVLRRARSMAASPELEVRTLIRHPLLWRPAAAPAPPLSLSGAPLEVLRHVAGYLDNARDLLSFAAVCHATRCVRGCCGLLFCAVSRADRADAVSSPALLRQPGRRRRGGVAAPDAGHFHGAAAFQPAHAGRLARPIQVRPPRHCLLGSRALSREPGACCGRRETRPLTPGAPGLTTRCCAACCCTRTCRRSWTQHTHGCGARRDDAACAKGHPRAHSVPPLLCTLPPPTSATPPLRLPLMLYSYSYLSSETWASACNFALRNAP